ncbi:MAG TPA: FAD-dependent oxidoreductase [Gammaproteobacteria bacterium]|nr:FAD-dependent oxidoreductase [Gammaproteobacteria bacterium]
MACSPELLRKTRNGDGDDRVDVAIVGAGLSGLRAATRLAAAGRSVRVFEARDRVGGKMLTEEIGGVAVDLGAHWIGPGQDRINALVGEMGIHTERQHLAGKAINFLGGRRRLSRSPIPPLAPHSLLEVGLAQWRMERLRRRVPVAEPLAAPGARRLDAQTLEGWKRRMLHSRGARALLDVATRLIWGAEPRELSLLYFLQYVNAGHGFQTLIDNEGGAQQDHLHGGTQQICERLAASLPRGSVVLNAPVRSLEQDDAGVAVIGDGHRCRARAAILALSPALAARIDCRPALPPARESLAQRMPPGAYAKAVLVFEHPWWRAEGLSGIATADSGPVQMVVDASPSSSGPGVLVAFVTGDPAREMGRLEPGQRRERTLAAVRRLFGDGAARPGHFHDHYWEHEPWSRGAPAGLMGPGVLSNYGEALRAPCGRLHWAGTETATEWIGYMEGALQAGERAAKEVIESY